MGSFFESGAIGLLIKGGWLMWPILLLGVVGAGVVIERWRSLRMLDTSAEDLRARVLEQLTHDQVEEALATCEEARGPVAAILANGLRKYLVMRRLGHAPDRIESQVIKSMEQYGVHVAAALERHLPILATVASVAPMMGFLGTVQGMIVAFSNIVDTMGQVNIVEAAAAGIQTALLTTCFGLIIGIPAYLGYNYFTGIINGFILEIEGSAAELVETVTLQMTLAEGVPDGQWTGGGSQ